MGATLIIETAAVHTFQRRFSTDALIKAVESANLYAISRRPRTKGAWSEAGGFAFDVVGNATAFPTPDFLSSEALRITFDSSGSYFKIDDTRAQLHGESWALAAILSRGAPTFANHEVLYIGRGENVNRRLEGHSTLQKILELHSSSEWDIFVTPLSIDGTMTMLEDHEAPFDTDYLGLAEYVAQREGGRAAEAVIKIAEHALISYFRPEFNKSLLYWNALAKSPEMKNLWRLGAHLCITIFQGRFELARFFSAERGAARSHAVASEIPVKYRERGFGSIAFEDMAIAPEQRSAIMLQTTSKTLLKQYEDSDLMLTAFGVSPELFNIVPGDPGRGWSK